MNFKTLTLIFKSSWAILWNYLSIQTNCIKGNLIYFYFVGECQQGHWKCSSSQDCQQMEEPCNKTCPEKEWKLNCQEKCDLIENPTFFKCGNFCQSVHHPCQEKCYFQDWQINCNGDCEKTQSVYDCLGNCTKLDVPCFEDCNGNCLIFSMLTNPNSFH